MTEPTWVEKQLVLTLHERLLALHGGASGLRDETLLKFALDRPQQHFGYSENVDIIRMAAIYTAGIIQNHPFVDGNKRTGFVIGILFLELNGYRFSATEEDAVQAVLGLAAGTLEDSSYDAFLRANTAL